MNELIYKETACDALDDLAEHYNHDLHEPIMANGIMEARAKIANMTPALKVGLDWGESKRD